MPQAGVHLLIARDTLDRWVSVPSAAPFDAAHPLNANAFMHGAVAPDIGFFPGGPQTVSSVVHEHRSGALTRALLDGARTERQTAFAWGWLSHVLADVLLHPLVNEASDLLVHARGATERADWLVAHVQVEVGLDAWCLRRQSLARLKLRDALTLEDHGFFAHALAGVIGLHVRPETLAAAHRNVTRLTNLCLPFVAAVGRSARTERAHGSLWTPTRRLLASWIGTRAPAHGFLVPVLPGRPFMRRIGRARGALERLYQQHVAESARHLPDYDLNTGRRVSERATPRVTSVAA